MLDVTYATSCYEGDWKYVLSDDRLADLKKYNNYEFENRWLILNNIKNETRPKVEERIQKAFEMGVFDRAIYAEDHVEETYNALGLQADQIGVEYKYSISEWVGITLCPSKYFLFYFSDCIQTDLVDWITPSVDLLDDFDFIKVANPLWNNCVDGARSESRWETNDFFFGDGFSDQCFLVKTSDFRDHIYNEYHPESHRYPTYTGNSFERRVFCWMRNNNHLRATYKGANYDHVNWPRCST